MTSAECCGKVWVGATLALALMDGALPLLLIAGAVGVCSYRIAKSWTKSASDTIYAETEADLQAQVEAATTEPERRAAERTLRKELEALVARQELDEEGNGRAAELIGVGTFATPVIGVAAMMATVAQKIKK